MIIKQISDVNIAAETNCSLGEGPVWNEELNALHFVDIFGKKVYTLNPQSGVTTNFSTELSPGAVIPTNDNLLLLAMNDGIYTTDYLGKDIQLKFSIEKEIAGNRMNDAKCDLHGKLFAGTMGDGKSATGSLYRIDSKGFKQLQSHITVSNGIAWSPSGEKIYYIDSMLYSVQVADFDLENSTIKSFKNFIQFDSSFGIPDGMCSDKEGGIWVAFFGGSQIRRFSDKGVQTHSVELPVPQITSCAFGGSDSSVLFITSANLDSGIEKNGNEGNLFCVDVGITGMKTTPFDLYG